MPIINIGNLGQGGIVRDKAAYDVDPEFWTDGQNVRFKDGKVIKITGDEELYDSWLSIEHPTFLLPWNQPGTINLLGAGNTSIMRWTGVTISDVTRGVSTVKAPYTASDSSIWSGCVLGGVPILNNDSSTDPPQSFNSATNEFQDLPNWTATDYCANIGSFKQYLVALDVTLTSVRQEHVVKWSSPALPGNVPDFWDNADTNDSNEQPLSEGGGILVGQKVLGDVNIIYKEEAAYAMQLTGGPFVFSFYKLPFEYGAIGPNAVVNFFGKHLVVTSDDVIVHDGQQAISVIDTYNREWFFGNLDTNSQRKTYVQVNPSNNEVWICFVSNGVGGTWPDTALIWNYKNNTWGHRVLDSYAYIALSLIDASGTSLFIDDQTAYIDTVTSFIDGSATNSGNLRLIGAPSGSTNSKLTELDKTNTNESGTMTAFVERTDLTITGRNHKGEYTSDPSTTKFVRRLYPQIECTGSVNIYIGSQARVGGAVTYLGPYSFDPSTDAYIDCRVQGKAIAIKVESTTDVHWEASGFSYDLEVIGGSNR